MQISNNSQTCRKNCAACCIIPSISSPLPGTKEGKPAFTPCPHLTIDLQCSLFNSKDRPSVCSSLQPQTDLCGKNREEAIQILTHLEKMTYPEKTKKKAVRLKPDCL